MTCFFGSYAPKLHPRVAHVSCRYVWECAMNFLLDFVFHKWIKFYQVLMSRHIEVAESIVSNPLPRGQRLALGQICDVCCHHTCKGTHFLHPIQRSSVRALNRKILNGYYNEELPQFIRVSEMVYEKATSYLKSRLRNEMTVRTLRLFLSGPINCDVLSKDAWQSLVRNHGFASGDDALFHEIDCGDACLCRKRHQCRAVLFHLSEFFSSLDQMMLIFLYLL